MKKLTTFLICAVLLLCPLTVFAENETKITITDSYIPFDVWQGSGTASAKLSGNNEQIDSALVLDEFEYLDFYGNRVEEKYYTAEEADGNVVITLNEDFLKMLANGDYYFKAEFEGISMPLKLYVVREKTKISDLVYCFDEWNGYDGLPSVHITPFSDDIPIGYALFESLKYKGEEIDEKNYTVSTFANVVTVQLTEEYYNSLPSGTHYFDVEFMSVSGIKLKLDIPVREFAGNVATASYYYYSNNTGGSVCYIDNDYFKLYHDAFFEDMYENYKTLSEFEELAGTKIGVGLYKKIKNYKSDIFYLCLYLNDTDVDVSEINGIAEVKYTSEKYPCAVVKVIGGDDIDSILANESIEYIGYSFDFVAPFWGDPGWSMQRNFNASDARAVLRIAAGIDKIERNERHSHIDEYMDFFAKDIDMDGKLTAADARGVLRIAAGLDEGKSIVYSY